jgi:hypothetical protein
VLVKVPSWVGRLVFSGSHRGGGGVGKGVRDLVIYKGARAILSGVGK